jgi:phospholipase/lecithinase/hemolysin
LYIFGDSLSDSGNNAVVLAPNVTPIPISGNSFIPTYPYASGRYTNDQVWAQTLASSLGLNANPSLLGGTDYAFGGAQTGPLTPNALPGGLLNPFPPSLETQAASFLFQHNDAAPSNALYVIAGGGEDALLHSPPSPAVAATLPASTGFFSRRPRLSQKTSGISSPNFSLRARVILLSGMCQTSEMRRQSALSALRRSER